MAMLVIIIVLFLFGGMVLLDVGGYVVFMVGKVLGGSL